MPNTREKLIELLLVELTVQGFLLPYGTVYRIAEYLIANGVTVLPESGIGDMSDGYHTFNELYHHRAVLFSVICNLHPLCSWKAKKHHDGTMYDGMFIVGINTPEGQATYHYDIDPYWDMFRVPEAEFAPTWDGHTPDEAIRRIGLLGIDEHNESKKSQTNADRIRAMSDEELAEWLFAVMSYKVACFGEGFFPYTPCRNEEHDCVKCGIKWLQQPAEGD